MRLHDASRPRRFRCNLATRRPEAPGEVSPQRTCVGSFNIVLLMLNLRPFLLNAGRTIFLIGISLSVTVTSGVSQAGNTPAAKTAADGDVKVHPDLAFDVVSIRGSNAGPDHQSRLQVVPGGDQYEAIGLPLGWTILMAYVPMVPISKDRIVGAPGWVWNDNYDVVGKVGEADMPDWRKSASVDSGCKTRWPKPCCKMPWPTAAR
jgi:hypothetical protein